MKEYSEAKAFIAVESNWGPLSLISTAGIPCLENIDFRALIMLLDVVDISFTASGNLEK